MSGGKDSDRRFHRLADSRFRNLYLYLAFAVSILTVIGNGFISNLFGNSVLNLPFGEYSIPASSISGVVQAVSATACILMVIIDYKTGFKLGIFTFLFSIFGIARGIIATGSMASLPGAANCVIFIFVTLLISNQLAASDRFALTDSSTGLPNRYGFERALTNRLSAIGGGYVAYLHVGGFHDLNANLGRKYGNIILAETAERIEDVIGEQGDVYKIEGAEFAIILSETANYESILEQTVDAVEAPIEVDRNGIKVNCFVTANVGVSDIYDRHLSTEEVMMCTDVAMNYAVNHEETKICTYNDALKAKVARTTEVEKLIKEALEKEYFYVQYQPQYVLDGKKLRGFEALVRLRMPDGSIVSPGEFIPIAEKTDLILEIDRYVRRRAMNEFKEICEKTGDSLVVSVNVSAKEVSSPGFADEVMGVVREVGFPAECLEIEITEYSLIKSVENTIANIQDLREYGVKIAVDDFGTGYTSLSQLLNLPVTLLKIDKSLIDNIEDSEINRDFVKTVIYMGHLMNCEVISEGVEKESQLRLLNQYDCDFIQGFVWSKPLDYDAAADVCR
ncbi:MAG: bifunctional diguanylate cyclase/phosphodiesterase [Lachnospiraceae bacterium]|nr:bifunctional diguanylate cyclase/phosphodiesterase [Lachnospiraceae bacterium]